MRASSCNVIVFAMVAMACGAPATTVEHAASVEEPSGTRYPIRLERAEHAGQRWRVNAVARDSRVREPVGIEGERMEETVVVELTAVTEVLEVDGEGRQLRDQHTIERLEATVEGETPGAILPPGSVVTVIRGDDPVVLVDGAEPAEAILEALDLALDFGVDTNDDEVFGTSEPRAIGERWPVDVERAQRMFPVRSEAMRGTVHIDERVDVDGQSCLFLRGHLAIDDLALPGLPPDARSSMHAQFDGVFPVDPEAHLLSERIKTTTTIEMQVEGRPIRTQLVRDIRRTLEHLPDRR